VRQNFHAPCEEGLNDQINMLHTAAYVYESMAYYFLRDDVALKGFYQCFDKTANVARGLAEKLMNYMEKRGGRVRLAAVPHLGNDVWGSGLDAMQKALQLEKAIFAKFESLHACAVEQNDSHLQFILEDVFLDRNIKWIRKLGKHITQLKRVGPGVGEYLYDKELRQKAIPHLFNIQV
jgi:ferritin heavy chain